MSSNYDSIIAEMSAWNLGIVNQDPRKLGGIISSFITKGSALYQLNSSEIVVYANSEGNFPGKQKDLKPGSDGRTIATTVNGLMAAGAKIFDATLYLSIDEKDRPTAITHDLEIDEKGDVNIPTYNDRAKLLKYLYAYYFYIIIRAHPPTKTGDYRNQPMPNFISTVLAVTESTAEVADYLAEFDLSKVNLNWIKRMHVKGLTQENASRLGLGVAGYRLPSIFNLIIPDKYTETNLVDKPNWLDDSILVAKSFRLAGFCWDFHPATRKPDVLTKYGNINKNIANLILEAYTEPTIKLMVETKKLAIKPIFDPAYTNYKTWTADMVYVAKDLIFK